MYTGWPNLWDNSIQKGMKKETRNVVVKEGDVTSGRSGNGDKMVTFEKMGGVKGSILTISSNKSR